MGDDGSYQRGRLYLLQAQGGSEAECTRPSREGA